MSIHSEMADLRPGGAPPLAPGVDAPAGAAWRGEDPDPDGHDRAGTITPFLSLYLLVLVFFIVLVSISAREELKSAKVMNSVSSTFAPDARSATAPAIRPHMVGQEMAGHMFHERVANLVSERLRVAKITVVKPGELMRVSLPADSLFHPGTADIRAFQDALLDRIVAELSSLPAGLSVQLEFEIGRSGGAGLPMGATLQVNRAGAFARRLLTLGAPPNTVSVALGPGGPRDVTLSFIVRGPDAIRMDLAAPDSRQEARHGT